MGEEKRTDTNEVEIWKDIPGFEGYYQVSNKGRVKGLPVTFPHKHCGYSTRPERLLKLHSRLKEHGGYTSVKLGHKTLMVHRLVALAFIPNDGNAPQVNHKDGDEYNNEVSNLEWCSCSENISHSYAIGTRKAHLKNIKQLSDHSRARKVHQISLHGIFIKEWGCMVEAATSLGYSRADGIRECALGRQHTAFGFRWKFA